MAFKFKPKGQKVSSRDASKSRRLHFVFVKTSKKVDRETKTEAVAPRPRSSVKITAQFNRVGDTRGLHAKANPPSSEHMKKIRAMRRFYNKQMPVLQCSGCAFAQSCPQFKAGYECAFLPYLNSHQISSEADLLESMKDLSEASIRRAHLQTLMETLTGGMPSLEVSESLKLAFDQVKDLHERLTEANRVSISVESEDESVIAKLFGNLDNLVGDTKSSSSNPIVVPLDRPALPMPDTEIVDKTREVNYELMQEHNKDEVDSLIAGMQKDDFSSKKSAQKNAVRALPSISISEIKKV